MKHSLKQEKLFLQIRTFLKPGSAEPVVSEKLLDMALGAFWMTKIIEGAKGEGKFFLITKRAINRVRLMG